MIDPFNKQMLLKKMPELTAIARVAFASACASRLSPIYEIIHGKDGSGDPSKLKASLVFCWESVFRTANNEVACKQQLQVVEDLIKSAYASKSAFCRFSQDATSIVFYSLCALESEKIENPIWAVQSIYESVARYVVCSEGLSLKGKKGLRGEALVSRINRSALMQLEFSRQLRDLEELSSKLYSPEVAMRLNRRAEAEPALPAMLPDTSNLPSPSIIQVMLMRDNEICL